MTAMVIDSDCHDRGLPLTGEELELLRLLAAGLPLDAVARRLGISNRTVRRRVRVVCDRLNVAHPVQAIVCAVRSGWL